MFMVLAPLLALLAYSVATAAEIAPRSPATVGMPTVTNVAVCPPGYHPAAPNEIPGVAAGTCTDDNKDVSQNTLYGGCDSNPYPFLEQRHSGDRSNSFITPLAGAGGTLKQGLNPALACRLKKFIEFAESRGCRLSVNSAMRPVQKCNPGGGACAPQGASCHQYGLAVDIGGNPQCLAWVLDVLGRKNANSPFGLHSAYSEHPGYRHLQCVENLQASCSPQTRGCDGKVNINPDLSGIPGPQPTLSDGIRRALGMQPQMPPQPQLPAQPQISSQSPQQTPPPLGSNSTTSLPEGTCAPKFYCANSTYYYRTSTCIDQAYQQCPNGCDSTGSTCSLSSSILGNLRSSPTSTTSGGSGATSSTTKSAFDLIEAYMNPVSSIIEIGTATSIALNQDIRDIAMTTAGQQGQNRQPATVGTSSALAPQYVGQQTFTSNDLSFSPMQGVNLGTNTFAYQTLETLKRILLYVLDVVRPFGGKNPQTRTIQFTD